MPASPWCHVTITAYGNWLPGDPRGFRTWNHREHVDGDYKNPPTQDYSERLRRNRNRRLAPSTLLLPRDRPIVAKAVRENLTAAGVLVICVSVGGCHCHVLGRFPPGDARELVGAAKRHVWFTPRDSGWRGRLWAKRCGVTRVRDRRHQLNVYRYILDHEREGAFVWAWHRDRDRE